MSERTLTREDIRAIREASAWPCECPEGISLVCSEVPGAVCTACKCQRWLEDGVKLSEGLK